MLAFSNAVQGQSQCVTDNDLKKMLVRLSSPQKRPLNKDIENELREMKTRYMSFFGKTIRGSVDEDKLISTTARTRAQNEEILCRIFRQHGWPTKDWAGIAGASAGFYLLKNNASFQTQKQLLPVIALAVKKNEIEKNEDLASFIDRLRLQAGLKQLFGTQAGISDGFMVLAPLQSEERINEWRNAYKMSPLAEYIRFLENAYQKPVIRSTVLPGRITTSQPATNSESKGVSLYTFDTPAAEDEVVRIESGLVNLNLSVLTRNLKTHDGPLKKEDFRVYENNNLQTISFFSQTDTPFDLILVLDLSGSTADKISLIHKSARKFVESKRPIDRLAILAFASDVQIVSPLTTEHATLLESIKKIEGSGGSNVWDAVKFAFDHVIEPENGKRRSAIVLMTDGADNALMYQPGFGSKTLFADLLETVRRSETTVIPIYLDTEGDDLLSQRIYRDARNTLAMLAKESGGSIHTARKVGDLSAIYERILVDLSRIYTVSYVSNNEKHRGKWSTIKVDVPTRPDLIARTKSGYYSK